VFVSLDETEPAVAYRLGRQRRDFANTAGHSSAAEVKCNAGPVSRALAVSRTQEIILD
jgi:hypothetical protein